MIVSGQVEIVVNPGEHNEMSLACLGPGQFFGEVELTQGGGSIASARAASQGTEIALLPRETFFSLIDGSPLTRTRIQEVATTRLAENRRRRASDR
jgi:CRP-like cAMP-binding protein